jgi:hypothetical protein
MDNNDEGNGESREENEWGHGGYDKGGRETSAVIVRVGNGEDGEAFRGYIQFGGTKRRGLVPAKKKMYIYISIDSTHIMNEKLGTF